MSDRIAGAESSSRLKAWPVFAWCLPALGGFAGFLASFPIDRQIPFWPYLSIAAIYVYWFLFVTPVACVIAIVKFIRYARKVQTSFVRKSILLMTIILSVLVNLFVVLGLIAAAS